MLYFAGTASYPLPFSEYVDRSIRYVVTSLNGIVLPHLAKIHDDFVLASALNTNEH